jgi:hypothetical protein
VHPSRGEGGAALPPGCEVRSKPGQPAAGAPLSQWARGFAAGYGYLEETWNEHLPAEFDQDLGAILIALSFFASPSLADTFVAEAKGKTSLEGLAETVVRLFPDAMLGYAHMGRAIYQALLESGVPAVIRNTPRSAATTRPCGSGRIQEVLRLNATGPTRDARLRHKPRRRPRDGASARQARGSADD